MPTFLLCVKIDSMENVDSVSFPIGYNYKFTWKESAGEATKDAFICADQDHDLSGSRGSAHLVLRFEKGGKECSASILSPPPKGLVKPAFTAEDHGKFIPLLALECRGMEPATFHLQDAVIVKSSSGKKTYDDADLTDDWSEYDELANLSLSISGFESKIDTHRG